VTPKARLLAQLAHLSLVEAREALLRSRRSRRFDPNVSLYLQSIAFAYFEQARCEGWTTKEDPFKA
jgi:hypothetical protein